MAHGGLQGWSADPFGQHHERYFSAGHPTKLVRDGTVECFDEPPSDTFIPADAVAEPDRFERAAAASAAPPWSTADPTDFYRGYAPGSSYPPDTSYPPNTYVPRPRRRRHLRLIVAVTAIAAALIVNFVVSKGSRSPSSSPDQTQTLASPAAFVTHSAEQTLAGHTSDLTVSGAISLAGKSVTVNGTGEMNFDTNAMALDLRMASSSLSFEEKEVLVGGNFYYGISVNGSSFAKLTGGRDWIQTPVQQSEDANLAGSDPLSSLSVLEQQGSTVRPLGSKTIDGVTCTGYAVTPSLQAMITATREEDAKLGASSAVTGQDLQQVRNTPPPTITIWSDAHALIHEISISLPINVQGSTGSGALVMDFSHIGAPVSITAPPPSDTISYSSFLQNLGRHAA
jgi:hypothetical protein